MNMKMPKALELSYGTMQDVFEDIEDTLMVYEDYQSLAYEDHDAFINWTMSNLSDFMDQYGPNWLEAYNVWKS